MVRNILRNKTLSIINILGLILSMSVGLLIIIIVRGQFSYDNFHNEADRIYRINTEALRMDGSKEAYASVPLAVSTKLVDEYDYVEKLVRLERQMNGDILYKGIKLPVEGVFVGHEFFEVFNFKLSSGSASSVLRDPYEVVLSHAASKKLFGDENPLGELISFGRFGEFKVTGVIKPFTGRSHFEEFEIYASFSTVEGLEKAGLIEQTTHNWNNYYTGSAYVKLKPGISAQLVEVALDNIYKKNYADIEYETRDRGYRFFLQNLKKITPGPFLSNSYGKGMPLLLIILLTLLGVLVMIMASFNYTQLMIAKSLSRAKEVGIRKIVGSGRASIFIQFIGEAVLLSLVALIASFLLLQLLKFKFSELNMTRDFAIGLSEGYVEWLYFLLFAIITGLFAGFLPALYISSFNPLNVLRTHGNFKVSAKLSLRKVLLITQFTLSLVFVMFIIAIREQTEYLVSADYGFDQENVMNIRLNGVNREQLINQVVGLPSVEKIGCISHSLGTWEDGLSDWKSTQAGNPFTMRNFYVDDNYLDVIGAQLIAGGKFKPDVPNQVILNNLGTKRFGFDNPLDAIGQTIYHEDSSYLTVVGVIKDFHIRPLTSGLEPVAFIFGPHNTYILSIGFTGDPIMLAGQLQNIWKEFDTKPLDWRLLSNEIDDAYRSAGLFDLLTIVQYCGALIIGLSCLGALGMAMANARVKQKEVAIHKITGASDMEIMWFLIQSFAKILASATVIGTLISIVMIDQFLSFYAYKATVSIWWFLWGVSFVVVIGMLTVFSQTYRLVTGNLLNHLNRE